MNHLVLFILLAWLGCTIIMTIHSSHASDSPDDLV
jgi:hypothetical protein